MARHPRTAPDGPGDQDIDDEFRSLLEGLRTTLPGVQIITGFLLTLPLQPRFDRLSLAEQVAFHVAFVTALTGSLLLMAPSVHQRLRARGGTLARRTPQHVVVATNLSSVGSVLFVVALVSVAYLVASVVLGTIVAVAVTAVIAVIGAWSWFYLPLVTFERTAPGAAGGPPPGR